MFQLIGLVASIEQINTERFVREVARKKSREAWVLLLYKPFCKRYKETVAALDQAAVITNGSVKYGAVNCQADSNICSQFEPEDYPSIFIRNNTKKDEFTEALNPVRIAKAAMLFIPTSNVKEVDDFWIDDLRQKPTAILFSKKNRVPGYWAAASRLYHPSKLRVGICYDEGLIEEMAEGNKPPSVVYFSENATIAHEGPLKFRYIRESLGAFLEGRDSHSPVPGEFYVNTQFPEVCYDYSVSCVLCYENFIDTSLEDIRNQFRNDKFRFFIGMDNFPFENPKRGQFFIYNAKKQAIIVENDQSKLPALLDRVIDGGAKWTPLKKFSYNSEL